MRILVVERNEAVTEMVAGSLARRGLEVVVSREGDDARRKAMTEAFDIVMMDLGLPGCNGPDLIRWLAAERPDTRVLAITSLSSLEDTRTIRTDVGTGNVAGSLRKPFGMDALVRKIEEIIGCRLPELSDEGA